MKTSPIEVCDLHRSVLAVPPLARHADLSANTDANRKLIYHLEAGGVSTLLYGGNANFYHIPLKGYERTLNSLEESASPETWVIPSAGPDYGRLMDQADVLRGLDFPTAMILPTISPATQDGTALAIRRFAERCDRKVILYVKSETYLSPDRIRTLVDDGLVAAIKYAVVRPDPAVDPLLERLVDVVDPALIVSGIGERPAITHFTRFGLGAFTSGSVCVAPAASMRLLRALQAGDIALAERIRERFLALEDLRDRINPIRVLHDAVTLAGIADMGPILPMLSNLEAQDRAPVAAAARALLDYDRTALGEAA